MVRFGVVGPQFPDSFADNIRQSLMAMGHSVAALGPAFPSSDVRAAAALVEIAQRMPRGRLLLQASLLRRVRQSGVDVVITVESLLPQTVEEMRDIGLSVALWFPDAISNLASHAMFLAPYNAIFFKEPRLVERSQALLDVPVQYLPEACNPAWHRIPEQELSVEPYLLLAGNMYPFRAKLLERLARTGIPMRIFGPPWASWMQSSVLRSLHTGRYVAREEKARVFRSAGAVLNPLHPGEIDGVNCRLFEAAACGASVLTESRIALDGLFEVGDEVTAYSTFDELVDRAQWLLENVADGQRIGDAAAARAHREHTYAHRLPKIIDALTEGL